jgi:hypothetical protein
VQNIIQFPQLTQIAGKFVTYKVYDAFHTWNPGVSCCARRGEGRTHEKDDLVTSPFQPACEAFQQSFFVVKILAWFRHGYWTVAKP